jgi:hypothetical protein
MVAVFRDTRWQTVNPQYCEKHQYIPLIEEVTGMALSSLPCRDDIHDMVVRRFHPTTINVLQKLGFFTPLVDYSVKQVMMVCHEHDLVGYC